VEQGQIAYAFLWSFACRGCSPASTSKGFDMSACKRCGSTDRTKSGNCGPCKKIYEAEWRRNNPLKKKIALSNWQQKNRIKMRSFASVYAKNNLSKRSALTAKRKAQKLQATPGWANDFFIAEIYDLAQRRTKATGFKWHVDHAIPLQSKLVCGLHVEHNLAVIPAAINCSKSNRYLPDLPSSAGLLPARWTKGN